MNKDCKNPAVGGPGLEPTWTNGDKDSIITAYSSGSRIWATTSNGVINEVYYPTIDRPQIRDLQFLIGQDDEFVINEQSLVDVQLEQLSTHSLGTRITSHDPQNRFKLTKTIINDPHLPCLLIKTHFEAKPEYQAKLKLYLTCNTHLNQAGWENNGKVVMIVDKPILVAYKKNTWLALAANIDFKRYSFGYVGVNDGYTDLKENLKLDWHYDGADDGNISITGELDLSQTQEFVVGVGFGNTQHSALSALFQALNLPFEEHQKKFIDQWERITDNMQPLEKLTSDNNKLLYMSQSLLLAHEDKRHPGALIASLSIPWGATRNDKTGKGGYHIKWTRDMVHSAMGLLATGNSSTPLRILINLSLLQHDDGGWCQNFWVNGEVNAKGVQLDQVALPILLAWRMYRSDCLADFDPYPMVKQAAAYLIRNGAVTPQERWEENSGYSPSTLASNIAALTCASLMARQRGEVEVADFIQDYADFLNCHLEDWTVTTQGTLVKDISHHFIRLLPIQPDDEQPNEDPNNATINIANLKDSNSFPAKEIVDAGFLELVRYGVRKANDPLIEDSLAVVDALLKVEFPYGNCWRRYNHDGYGQRPDGTAFDDWGQGRAWPLLTGERGHYELAAGRPVQPYLNTMEKAAHSLGLLTEQLWDAPDLPDQKMFFGKPTHAAMPLMWAHAEYLRLLRSTHDGQIFDFIPEVAEHYQQAQCQLLEIWKFNRQIKTLKANHKLRIQANKPFVLQATLDDKQTKLDSLKSGLMDIHYADLDTTHVQSQVRFTFRWLETNQWENQEFTIKILR